MNWYRKEMGFIGVITLLVGVMPPFKTARGQSCMVMKFLLVSFASSKRHYARGIWKGIPEKGDEPNLKTIIFNHFQVPYIELWEGTR